jgi:hypothetical protein
MSLGIYCVPFNIRLIAKDLPKVRSADEIAVTKTILDCELTA